MKTESHRPSGGWCFLLSHMAAAIGVAAVMGCATLALAVPGDIVTIAGNGTPGYSGDGADAQAAELNLPQHVALGASGALYFVDNGNHVVRRIDESTNAITTIAGNGSPGYTGDGGPATAAQLFNPWGVAVDADGNVCGAYDAQTRAGWSGTASKWKFVDSSGQLASGLTKILLVDRSGGAAGGSIQLTLTTRKGTFSVGPADRPVNAVLVLGGRSAAAAGLCAESRFTTDDCQFNASATALKCRR